MIDAGYVKTIADIYFLSTDKLLTLDLFKEKRANNLD